MSMRGPIKMSTTFLVFFPNHLFLPECGWVSYCMEGEDYGQPNSNWAETHFWKTCSDFLGKENAQKRRPFCYAYTFFSFLTFWEQLEFFLCLSFHVFGCWLHFSHGWEVVFVVLGIGLFFLTIWELLVHFPFTILSDPPHAQQAGSHLLLLPTISWNCCKFVWESFWPR